MPDVVEAHSSHCVDVILHRQFAVQSDTKVTDNIDMFNVVIDDSQRRLAGHSCDFLKIARDPNHMNPVFSGFIWSRLDR